MADYALDGVMNAEDDRFEYRMGRMSDARAYDLGIIDELGEYNHPPMFSAPYKICKYCGKKGLVWFITGTGWRLAEKDGIIHSCEKYVPPER